ncbi:MAG: hypothetical protein K2X87_19470 [Gemmataceae bacterium]|nr:hypothetical protein [Gemmataceae bacterium]
MTTIPVARGLILCESSWADDFTGRLTLTGCFHELTAPSFPTAGRTFWVATFLSDGFGNLRARVEVVHPDRDRTIYTAHHGLGFPSRLSVVQYRYQVSGCIFPEPGLYEAQLIIEDELIAGTALTIRQEEADHG